LITKRTSALEETGGRQFLVVEEVVAESVDDDSGDLALVRGYNLFQTLQVVVLEGGYKGALGGGDAGGDGCAPGMGAVIGALGHDDLVAAGVGAGHSQGPTGDVGAILGEHRPIGGRRDRHQKFGQFHPLLRGEVLAVDLGVLGHGRFLNLRVAVSQNDGSIGAHEVDVLVAIHVPDAAPFTAG
jgi:hypothetical protein